jgi:hypothetical protein
MQMQELQPPRLTVCSTESHTTRRWGEEEKRERQVYSEMLGKNQQHILKSDLKRMVVIYFLKKFELERKNSFYN